MIPKLILEATLPGGRKIKLRELTGGDEMIVASDIQLGESGLTATENLQNTWAAIMRALVEVDGKAFDPSSHTPETTRDLFSAKEYKLVLDAYHSLHTPTNEEVAAFRKAFKVTSEEAGAGGRVPRQVRRAAG